MALDNTDIQAALASRKLLPMDGQCACLECGAHGLNRDDMCDMVTYGHQVCRPCDDRIKSGSITCSDCNGTGGASASYHYVRQSTVTNWCLKCDGEGYIRTAGAA